jgi:cytochrome c oxidase cbb3-type subunit IV
MDAGRGGEQVRMQHVASDYNGVTMQLELTIYHWILIAAFVGIVGWVFGRKRKARFEKDANTPFEDGKG